MYRVIGVLGTLGLLLWLTATATAGAPLVQAYGGGTGTFNADLDADGDIDGSQFGFGVTIDSASSARGHFTCVMAGRSDILGLSVMAVQGKVTSGLRNGDGSVTFNGVGSVNLGQGQKFTGVPFAVTVTSGGPGVGTLTLTVIGAFDGVPGDTLPGNGNYDLPTEIVQSGQIAIH